jgi:aspartate/methionine/tyrosine aminotransferase
VIVDGFNVTFSIRPSIRIIPVGCDGSVEDTLSSIDYFEASLETAIYASEFCVRALVLTNPHNPFGRCYTKEMVKLCAKFCQKHNIHFISDEVYALSVFEENGTGFSSALQLDPTALEVDPDRVHVIWSTSKDFGSSGVRVGAIVSQANERLRASLALASNIQVSSLAAIATTGLLNYSELDQLIRLNRQRLKKALGKITAFFKTNGIHYLPATAGPFIFAKLPGNISSLEEEQRAVDAISSTGLTVSPGTNYAWSKREFGWVRITFAVEPIVLDEGLKRLVYGLKTVSFVLKELRRCRDQQYNPNVLELESDK